MFFPSELVLDNIRASVSNAAATDPRFEINAGGEPHSEWRIDGGTADPNSPCSANSRVQVITRFAIFLRGVCHPTGLGLDVNVRLTTTLSLMPGNVLRTEVHLDFTPDEGDALVCAFVNSILGGLAASPPILPVLGPTIASLAAGFISFIAIFTYNPGSISVGGGFTAVPGSDRDFVMDIPLDTDLSLRNEEIRINEMAACPDGFCLRGAAITRQMELLLADELIRREPFGWAALGMCTDEDPLVNALAMLNRRLERTRPGFAQMPLSLFRTSSMPCRQAYARSCPRSRSSTARAWLRGRGRAPPRLCA